MGTISDSARSICRKLSRKAEEIFVDDKKLTLHGLQQHFVELEESQKIRKLNDLLDALDFNQVVVFVKTKQRAAALDKMLQKCFFPSMCIHSDPSKKNDSIATASSRNTSREFLSPPTSLDVVLTLNECILSSTLTCQQP